MTLAELTAKMDAEREARIKASQEARLDSQIWIRRSKGGRWVEAVTQFGNSMAGAELVTVREARARGVYS
jgi:hypothetical protein